MLKTGLLLLPDTSTKSTIPAWVTITASNNIYDPQLKTQEAQLKDAWLVLNDNAKELWRLVFENHPQVIHSWTILPHTAKLSLLAEVNLDTKKESSHNSFVYQQNFNYLAKAIIKLANILLYIKKDVTRNNSMITQAAQEKQLDLGIARFLYLFQKLTSLFDIKVSPRGLLSSFDNANEFYLTTILHTHTWRYDKETPSSCILLIIVNEFMHSIMGLRKLCINQAEHDLKVSLQTLDMQTIDFNLSLFMDTQEALLFPEETLSQMLQGEIVPQFDDYIFDATGLALRIDIKRQRSVRSAEKSSLMRQESHLYKMCVAFSECLNKDITFKHLLEARKRIVALACDTPIKFMMRFLRKMPPPQDQVLINNLYAKLHRHTLQEMGPEFEHVYELPFEYDKGNIIKFTSKHGISINDVYKEIHRYIRYRASQNSDIVNNLFWSEDDPQGNRRCIIISTRFEIPVLIVFCFNNNRLRVISVHKSNKKYSKIVDRFSEYQKTPEFLSKDQQWLDRFNQETATPEYKDQMGSYAIKKIIDTLLKISAYYKQIWAMPMK